MWGVKLGDEAKLRDVAQQVQTDNITSELAMFSFPVRGGEELRGQPVVYVPNIVEKITSLLDENEK